MSLTYNNVPMTEKAAACVAKSDERWNGPRLIILSFVTLGVAFALLWLSAQGWIGPHQTKDSDWSTRTHVLQPGGGPLD